MQSGTPVPVSFADRVAGTTGCGGEVGERRLLTRPGRYHWGMDSPLLLADPPVADLADHQARGGLTGLQRALELGPGATIQEVILSGLRGRGGAGFPTGRKWQSVRDAVALDDEDGGADRAFVVCNGAEGEPATFKDRAIVRANPYAVVEGVAIAAFAIGAERAFIGIKERFEVEAQRLAAAVDEFTAAGLLDDAPIQVVLGPDHYLYGEETGLLQVIEGEAPLPRNVPPYLLGLFATVPAAGWTASGGRVATEFAASNPTVVNNVETLATVPLVLARGPEWHRSLGTERSPGVVVATVVGDVVATRRRRGGARDAAGRGDRPRRWRRAPGPDDQGRPVRCRQPGPHGRRPRRAGQLRGVRGRRLGHGRRRLLGARRHDLDAGGGAGAVALPVRRVVRAVPGLQAGQRRRDRGARPPRGGRRHTRGRRGRSPIACARSPTATAATCPCRSSGSSAASSPPSPTR